MTKPKPKLIGELLELTAERTARRAGLVISTKRWRETVGQRIAKRTRPGPLQGGTLFIYVASAVWAQELSFLTPTLLSELRGAGIQAKNLRFMVEPNVFQPPKAQKRPQPTKEIPLPQDLEERLDKLQDTALRALIKDAAKAQLSLAAARDATPPPAVVRARESVATRSGPPVQSPTRPSTVPPGTSVK